MLDALGINQHHDAITGTGRQAVADDYSSRLFKSMEQNLETYTSLIGDRLMQCTVTNTTYLDCPVA
jgi:hypothetical protein